MMNQICETKPFCICAGKNDIDECCCIPKNGVCTICGVLIVVIDLDTGDLLGDRTHAVAVEELGEL